MKGANEDSIGPGTAEISDADLGLAVLKNKTRFGQRRSMREIAAYLGCTYGNVYWIEVAVLKKLRTALLFRKDPVLTELVQTLLK